MPRPLRVQEAGYVHHVVCRGNDRQVIFPSLSDFKVYIDILEEARQKYALSIYNYVLMGNHVHLLVEPKEDKALSLAMESVSKAYAKYFNKKYDRVGHVFQGRFKSFLVQEERYFFACSRYIDLNPVKAGMVSNPADYLWSGFSTLAEGRGSMIKLDKHQLYLELGKTDQERQIAYRTLVNHSQVEELDLLNKRAGILGDKEYKKKLKRLYELKDGNVGDYA